MRKKMCPNCDGFGCEKCHGTGEVDAGDNIKS